MSLSYEIRWVLVVEILPGQLDNFRLLAHDLIAATQEEEGTLGYEWNLSIDNTSCHIYERYANSAALEAHVQNFHKFAERFLQTCRPVRMDVYGFPSEAAQALIADFKPVYYPHLGGFSR
jgi:quinol monooxygenase YgiN